MKIYLAGPMRGYPDGNASAFAYWTVRLRETGHEIFNPVEHELTLGYDASTRPIRDCMLDDMSYILREAEAVVVLNGWERSRGALAEMHTAWCCDIPVYRVLDVLTGALTPIPFPESASA
jgi:Domain of unknown function (DUF4406)